MLIGIDASRAVAQHMTGTEVYSRRVIDALLSLSSGHDFRLYTRSPEMRPEWRKSHVSVLQVRPARLWTHVGLSLEATRRPPEVLFVPAHVVPLARRCPTVVTIHDVGYLDYPQAYTRSRWWYLHLSTWFSARQARLVLADSRFTARELVKRYHVPEAKVRTVHLACDEAYTPSTDQARQQGIRERHADGNPFFLYVGTLQPRKNVTGLLRAFAQFARAQEGKEWLLVAGAKGWLYQGISELADELGISGRVRFLGYVPDHEIRALLNAATALALPSFYEGFGLPVLQAMASGTPVLASNVTSIPEIVGDAGLLVDPHDTDGIAAGLVSLSSDVSLRGELAARGLARAARFSWQKCARETLAALEAAAGSAGRN